MKEMAAMAPVRRSSLWPTAVLDNPPQRQNRIWMITIPYHSGMINLMAILASLVMFTISQNHFYALAVGIARLCNRPSVCVCVCMCFTKWCLIARKLIFYPDALLDEPFKKNAKNPQWRFMWPQKVGRNNIFGKFKRDIIQSIVKGFMKGLYIHQWHERAFEIL